MRIAVVLLLLCGSAAWGQTEHDVADGKATFRSNCAFCHGLTGGGGRGPALISRQFLHGSTDDDIENVIRNGVPGTNMPAFDFEKEELDHLVTYLRTLAGAAPKTTAVTGDPVKGRQVYERSGCAGCGQTARPGIASAGRPRRRTRCTRHCPGNAAGHAEDAKPGHRLDRLHDADAMPLFFHAIRTDAEFPVAMPLHPAHRAR